MFWFVLPAEPDELMAIVEELLNPPAQKWSWTITGFRNPGVTTCPAGNSKPVFLAQDAKSSPYHRQRMFELGDNPQALRLNSNDQQPEHSVCQRHNSHCRYHNRTKRHERGQIDKWT